MKAMVIGLNPNYNYPGSWDKWLSNNTYYASNLGASLIVRSIMKEFNAEYVDDFSDIPALKNKYDTCFLGLATHAHARRDISQLVEVLEKLEMKVVILSLGVEDYLGDATGFYRLHPSVIRLLELGSAGTKWIGVRGPYTATILQQNGFRNVVPIGCPTMYSNLTPKFRINTKATYTSPMVVYHRTIAANAFHLIKDIPLLGQDYEDDAFFTNRFPDDFKLQNIINAYYSSLPEYNTISQQIKAQGIFTPDFEKWFGEIAKHDFVFGPRLHGCIAALIQGIPAVFTPRDLRVREIVEFFELPNIPYSALKDFKLNDIYHKADYHKFQNTFKLRYKNYISFINENKLDTQLQQLENPSFSFTVSDIQTYNQIAFSQIKALIIKNEETIRKRRFFHFSYYRRNIKARLKKLLK